ncbi:MAG: 5-(carboxyamino)imidazole ribonucleotide mutase [Acidobacteria bacterium]|nr:MAG: 5-(carboxyamino)imidazole ribonucleotide mutase [Acidobacteriota bacterium]RLE21224.1 MAG: 5-(carboxyamino)imidazole ribonucleotide mutase [Acidobacteriota bacterium]
MEISPLIAIVMGSDSDFDVMKEAAALFKEFDIPFEMLVSSAHRTPERTSQFARKAEERGLKAIIVGAGAAAHLAGIIAAETILPVIGVPIAATSLSGMDALLSTVQMPGGIPVATMAIGKAGAKNAALFAAELLATENPDIREKLNNYRGQFKTSVEEKSKRLQKRLETFLNE